MANTINVNHTEWDGVRGALHYNLSSDGTAISDTVLIDISTLSPAPTAIKILSIQLTLYGNFALTFEFDATTDTAFVVAENQTADVSYEFVRDFTGFPGGGWHVTAANKAAAGFTGDLLVTSTGLASGDGFDLVAVFEKD